MLDDPKRPPPSNSPHHGAKLTSYKGDPFVAGGLWHRKTEKLSWTDSNGEKDVEKISGWEYVDDFPSNIRGSIYRYAAVSTGDAVYITACCIKPSYIPPGKSESFQAGSIEHEIVGVCRTANKAGPKGGTLQLEGTNQKPIFEMPNRPFIRLTLISGSLWDYEFCRSL